MFKYMTISFASVDYIEPIVLQQVGKALIRPMSMQIYTITMLHLRYCNRGFAGHLGADGDNAFSLVNA